MDEHETAAEPNDSQALQDPPPHDHTPIPSNEGQGNPQLELAVERTILAEERTYDAWVRTGLALLASGIGAHTLLKGTVPDWLTKPAGAILVMFAAFCFIAGVWREVAPSARLPMSKLKKLPPGFLIGVNGVLVIIAFAAFVGVISIH